MTETLQAKVKYRIYGRKQFPLKRTAYGDVDERAGWIWGSWYYLGCVYTPEEATLSVMSWKKMNPRLHDYKYVSVPIDTPVYQELSQEEIANA